jgi:hypothetical protein
LRSSMRVLVVHAVEDGELPADTDVDATTAVLYGMLPGYALQRMLTGLPDKATFTTGVRTLIDRR